MHMDRKQYEKYAAAHAPKSPVVRNCARAFFTGGAICCIAEALIEWYMWGLSLSREEASSLGSVSVIFIAVLLTAIGVFDKLAHFAGAGTLVPITGFANAVAAPAIDFKSEGLVTGTAARIFTVAGPVIAFGTLSSALYGLILWMTALP